MSATGFEGVEKKLVLNFARVRDSTNPHDADNPASNLRSHNATTWQTMLDHARCTIISSLSNDHCDSYVLSESSLFVYADKLMIKTCGTTRLLHAIPYIIKLARDVGMEPDSVFYCRKNFRFPECQPHPHRSFEEEVAHLNTFFHSAVTKMFGPRDDEHWCFYLADLAPERRAATPHDEIFEVMMMDLDATKMARFFMDTAGGDAKHVTHVAGIGGLLPGALTDETLFEPCGYSVNGLLGPAYFTIHVTPEPECSFVSFETNAPLAEHPELLARVLAAFRPARWSVATLAPTADSIALVSGPQPGFTRCFTQSLAAEGRSASFSSFRQAASPPAAQPVGGAATRPLAISSKPATPDGAAHVLSTSAPSVSSNAECLTVSCC
mmetsp:Transcript_36205/g.90851  ORF Transcript_36205/g.90851 Transcript_36205/m.90851 type:complete len:381 (+) Transcript_36205:253-1395(+)